MSDNNQDEGNISSYLHYKKVGKTLSNDELIKMLGTTALQPSPGLFELWTNIGKCTDYDVYFHGPCEPMKLTKEKYEGCGGISKLDGRLVFNIGIVYDGTDSSTRYYEFADGEEKGQIIFICHNDDHFQITNLTTEEYVDFLKKQIYRWEISDDILNLFIDRTIEMSDSEESYSENYSSQYSPR